MSAQTPSAAGAFRTAVVPAAGLGTRFLPTTKAVPKELLPVVDTPGIELVAAEAAEAGAQRLLIVTSPGKDSVADYFRPDEELVATLRKRGKDELAERVGRAPGLLEVDSVYQHEPKGLGHAVAQAGPALGDDEQAVAVLLPDDLVFGPDGDDAGVLARMAQVRTEHGGTVLCAFDVPREQISAYGVFDVTGTDDADVKRVHGMVEKPEPDQAPSTFAAAGRYLLDRAVFEALERIGPGAGGELQLTDAIALLIDEGHPVHVVVHRGGRHDLGNPAGYVRAYVDHMLAHPEYGASLRGWLNDRLKD
ncbi:UTP--glucose-1-phosphate uridylyltransferase [Pseudonocardia ammonioxydans]|uniref:UTP--glucose-1-phosphate uridylyltransferase n=1 Tax=Pseudonocardia ammonioxydans TaxID=260086 RepID=A0A1I5FF41_PSUAM|nr:UTP--glucose-1-phosphate uridylyltransferase [Pseudonocardia ammonioxydans]SFO22340.1 UTP--glucose-1-phosphate uridylyltransferase [Pseudonocardia ammonioxydans]